MTKIDELSEISQPTDDANQEVVRGSIWMTVGSLVSRILGAIWVIPWMAWMGGGMAADAAHGLFQIGYQPYGLLVELSTAGIPSAISQQVSHYNQIGEYEISKSIYKRAVQLMLITGIVSALVLWFIAPSYAELSAVANPADAVRVIRALVPAVLVIPVMSVTRGFIQGHSDMSPSAISQMIEQFARVVFILVSVYLIMVIGSGDTVKAVSYSTFAAFVGALFSIFYLAGRIRDNKYVIHRDYSESNNQVSISTKNLMIDIIKTALPFIIISTGISMSIFIDNFTFSPIMSRATDLSDLDIQILYGISHANANKLIMIIISFGTAMASTSVPVVSKLMARKDYSAVRLQFVQNVQMLFLVMVPASFGMSALAGPFYTIFYSHNAFGANVTRVYAFVGLLWALYIMLANFMKATNIVRPTIRALIIGLGVKLIVQVPAVWYFETYGMLISTIIGFVVMELLMFWEMDKKVSYNKTFLAKRILLITIMGLIMMGLVYLVEAILYSFLDVESRLHAIIVLAVCVIVGGAVYVYMVLKTRLGEDVFGQPVRQLRLKLGIK